MFNGYSTETVDFLWGIRFNNNREWFQANKETYTKYLYEPTKELGRHLYEPFLDTPGLLCKVSRIYRDARLHPPVPYKRACGSASAGMWPGGRTTPACILRSTRRGSTTAASSGIPSP